MPLRCLAALAFLLAAAPLPAAWLAAGGPEAGTVLEIDTGPGRHVWAATATAGLFHSADGGESWARTGLDPSGLRIDVFSLAAHPADPDTVLVGTRNRLLTTTDGGATWQATPFAGDVEAIAFYPGDPGVLYLATENHVWQSRDGGHTWGPASGPSRLLLAHIYTLAVDPRDPATVYAGTSGGVLRTANGGRTWTAGRGLGTAELTRIAVDPRQPEVVYGGARHGGLWKSADRGATWTRLTGLDFFALAPGGVVQGLAVDPASPGTLYAGIGRAEGPPPYPLVTLSIGNVLRSRDGGRTWQLLVTTEVVNDLAIARSGRLYAATDAVGVWRSVDRGTVWQPANHGLTAALVQHLTPDPHNPGALYAAVSSYRKALFNLRGLGIWKSVDAGRSWLPATAGLPDAGPPPEVTDLLADPIHPGVLYAATTSGLFKTADGGGLWQRADPGSPVYPQVDLAFGLADPLTLYAAGEGSGDGTFPAAAKTVDGGATWTGLGRLFSTLLFEIETDPAHPDTVAAVDGETFWLSHDAGETWAGAGASPAFGLWSDLLAVPDGPFYAAAEFQLFRGRLGTVMVSWDTLRLPSSDPSQTRVFDLDRRAADPLAPLFVATERGVFAVSPDGERRAQVGRRELWTLSVAVDPFTPSRLYAGTRQGVVFRIDGAPVRF